jgi:HEAT repeat protein
MLNESLEDGDSLASQASDALGSIGGDAVPALLDVLGEVRYPPERRSLAVVALKRMAGGHDRGALEKVLPLLIASLREEDEGLRSETVDALHAMGETAYVARDALSDLVEQSESEVLRVKAARALCSADPGNALGVLAIVGGLKAKDREARLLAAHAAGSLGRHAVEVVPALAEALTGEDDVSRREVAAALGSIGPGAKDAIPALQAALLDKDKGVRTEAREALKEIVGRRPRVTGLE